MMYRSSWGSAVGKERVLAIRIRREGFEWDLAHSVLSGYDGRVHTSRDEWNVGFDDVTGLSHAVHALTGDALTAEAARLLPLERRYPLTGALASRVSAT
jgi:hypothetical protein